jgi:hypothetical protein
MPAGEDQRLNGLDPGALRAGAGGSQRKMWPGCRDRRGGYVPEAGAVGVAAPSTYRKDSHAKTHSPAMGHRRQHRRGGGRRAQLRVSEPFSETTNPAFKASVMGFIDSVDTMILGANTYAQAKDYWPYTTTRASTARSSTTSLSSSPRRGWMKRPGATFPPRP